MLKNMLAEEYETIKNDSKNKFHEMKIIIMKIWIKNLDANFPISESEKNKIVDFLISIEEWGYYELTLIKRILSFLEAEFIVILIKKIVQKTELFKNSAKHKTMIVRLLIDSMFIFIETKYFKIIGYLMKKIENLLDGEMNLSEKNMFLYARGFYYWSENNDLDGKKMMQKSIEIFEILGSKKMASVYRGHYEKILR